MPDLVDHVAYLTQGIGPRPAGTEEEQQAALYIADQLQQEAGLRASVEDIESMQSGTTAHVICCAAAIVVALASMIFPSLGVVGVIVTVLTALLFAMEELGRPLLSRASSHGVSQNVIAKYEPGYSPDGNSSRRRKIVLVTHYDTGKVRPQYSGGLLKALPVYQWGCLVSMVLLPVLLFVRNVIMKGASGGGMTVMNVLVVIALVCPIMLILFALMDRVGEYSEGANCNATGTAALIEIARRVNSGAAFGAPGEGENAGQSPTIHGERAVRATGLVPEGAQLVYEASKVMPPERAPRTPEERLASAKAAVAALTGKPVSGTTYVADVADKLVQVGGWSWAGLSEEEKQARRDAAREALESMSPRDREEAMTQAEAAAKASAEEHGDEASAEEVAEAAYVEAIDAFVASTDAPDEDAAADVAAQPSPVSTAVSAVTKVTLPSEYVPTRSSEEAAVPDWYRSAQEKAKKSESNKPVHRSRYAEVLDAAVSESSEYFAEANTIVERRLEETLHSGREEIREVKAPAWAIRRDGERIPAVQGAVSAVDVPDRAAQAQAAQAQAAQAQAAQAQAAPLDAFSFEGDETAFTEIPLPSFLSEQADSAGDQARTGEQQGSDDHGDAEGFLAADEAFIAQQSPADTFTSLNQFMPASMRRVELPKVASATPASTSASFVPVGAKQRAPLAEAQTSTTAAAKSLLTMLPTIQVEQEGAAPSAETSVMRPMHAAGAEGSEADASEARASSLANLPSLSGSLHPVVAPSPSGTGSISAVGSFQAAGATGAFAPVGEELLEGVAPEDVYVDDADDSVFEGGITQTGAFAGPGYVEMPKTRKERFLGLFHGKKKKAAETRADEQTPQEWLNVDESFDPRVVGAQRGGWESFQDGAGAYSQGFDYGQTYAPQPTYDSQGYAQQYDQSYAQPYEQPYGQPYEQPYDQQGAYDYGYTGGYAASYDEAFEDVEGEFGYGDTTGGSYRWQGGAYSADQAAAAAGGQVPYAADYGDQVPEELDEIQSFRAGIDTEVWFVALGSELAKNSGMRAFLNEHSQDLRGAIIIDIEALGAGDLCLIEREGCYRPVKTSSRMGRLVRKAGQTTGLRVGSASMCWEESAATVAMKRGFQVMHLAGMQGGKPAMYAELDVIENVDFNKLNDNVDFIVELLRVI